MPERDELIVALGRAGRRALVHLIQAAIEGVKAVESVIDELGNMSGNDENDSASETERIEIQ